MKKTILKRILVFTIVFLMTISTPFSIYGNLYNNNIYVYAATATFEQMLDSELFDHLIIPTLISAGLVFAWPDDVNTSYEHVNRVKESLKDYFKDLGGDYEPPNDPKNRKLEELIKNSLIGSVVFNAGIQGLKVLEKIDDVFWDLVRNWVNDMYDEGELIIYSEHYISNSSISNPVSVAVGETVNLILPDYGYCTYSRTGLYTFTSKITSGTSTDTKTKDYSANAFDLSKVWLGLYGNELCLYSQPYNPIRIHVITYSITDTSDLENNEDIHTGIFGITGIIDNPNHNWNNKYTDTKVIPIPIQTDVYGNPKKDENGLYLPSIDIDEWLDVQPTEIPNLDPSGTPVPDIPPFPDIENPDNDENTTIFIYIGDILKKIAETLIGIGQDVKTIVMNTNKIVFGTSQPVFDPTTGQQIDPETGQPVEPEPEASTGDGIIGDGIDTNIPTDFEWGDFRHFIDIFFIFIYFIVILILILLKFLQIVFTGLPGIAPNTDLFTAYPEILAGVDYVKNLKVGGLTITVHQAFEFVFLIFFYIFIIKQIRKLYNAMVFEESAIPINHTKDMKLDYYDGNGKINQYGYIPNQIAAPNQNLLPYVEENQKGNLNYAAKHPSEYQNIKITDYTEG